MPTNEVAAEGCQLANWRLRLGFTCAVAPQVLAALSLCICNSCWCTLPPPCLACCSTISHESQLSSIQQNTQYPADSSMKNEVKLRPRQVGIRLSSARWRIFVKHYLFMNHQSWSLRFRQPDDGATTDNVRWSHMQEGRQSVHYCHTKQITPFHPFST